MLKILLNQTTDQAWVIFAALQKRLVQIFKSSSIAKDRFYRNKRKTEG